MIQPVKRAALIEACTQKYLQRHGGRVPGVHITAAASRLPNCREIWSACAIPSSMEPVRCWPLLILHGACLYRESETVSLISSCQVPAPSGASSAQPATCSGLLLAPDARARRSSGTEAWARRSSGTEAWARRSALCSSQSRQDLRVHLLERGWIQYGRLR